MSIEGQAALAEEFVRGVVAGFGISATVSSTLEDEHIKVSVEGDGVGYLIGPRGSTIDALQELTRTVVQRRGEDASSRVHVDVGGYRARRAAALAAFAQKVAREVLESGEAQSLEPMNPADRKVVHDAVHEVAGVITSSEGEEPRRYVVIRPAPGAKGEEVAEGAVPSSGGSDADDEVVDSEAS